MPVFSNYTFGLLTIFVASAASSSEIFEVSAKLLASTHLMEVTNGSELSKTAAAFRSAGFQSSEGKEVSFDKWYSTVLSDTRITWITQMTPEFGLVWGISTGERGEKYAIAPSIKLGFVYQTQLSRWSNLSIRASSVISGRFREKSCTADYGDIGGVQEVNCRLAASNLQPAETLQYLIDALPRNRNRIFITYTALF